MINFDFLKKKSKPKENTIKTPAQKIKHFIWSWTYIIIIVILIKSFLIETSRVPTGSMLNTIQIGDFLFVNKFLYGSSSPRNIPFTDIALPYFSLPGLAEPERGDIIVFEYPGHRDQLKSDAILNYVKRCMALPGDTIEIVDKVVFINGSEAPIPPYIVYDNPIVKPKFWKKDIDMGIFPKGSGWNPDNYGPYVVPKEGDVIPINRDNIEWWRTIINREAGREVVSVIGDVVKINGLESTSYKIQKDYFFMMGDNRDSSEDSRFWGLVPRDAILGQPFMVYWSWDPEIPFSNMFKLLGSVRIDRIGKLVK